MKRTMLLICAFVLAFSCAAFAETIDLKDSGYVMDIPEGYSFNKDSGSYARGGYWMPMFMTNDMSFYDKESDMNWGARGADQTIGDLKAQKMDEMYGAGAVKFFIKLEGGDKYGCGILVAAEKPEDIDETIIAAVKSIRAK